MIELHMASFVVGGLFGILTGVLISIAILLIVGMRMKGDKNV